MRFLFNRFKDLRLVDMRGHVTVPEKYEKWRERLYELEVKMLLLVEDGEPGVTAKEGAD